MKCFENPEMKIEKFEFSDVIAASGTTCPTQLPCFDD